MPNVLLIEDDTRLAPLVTRHLSDGGFGVTWVTDA
jgi:DNA-binding response OmpR family regulator